MLISVIGMIYLAGLAVLDVRNRELSVKILLLGTLVALTCGAYHVAQGLVIWEDLLLGAVPGMVLLSLAGITKGAGIGDGIVLLQMNFFLLLDKVIVSFGISLLSMGLFSLLILLTKKGSKDTRLPYLPFLWVGCLGAICLQG